MADAPPAYGVEVVFVGHDAERVAALRAVAVNVVERAAGVVAGGFADFEAFAPARAQIEHGAVGAPVEAAQREGGQRGGQFVGFAAAFAV